MAMLFQIWIDIYYSKLAAAHHINQSFEISSFCFCWTKRQVMTHDDPIHYMPCLSNFVLSFVIDGGDMKMLEWNCHNNKSCCRFLSNGKNEDNQKRKCVCHWHCQIENVISYILHERVTFANCKRIQIISKSVAIKAWEKAGLLNASPISMVPNHHKMSLKISWDESKINVFWIEFPKNTKQNKYEQQQQQQQKLTNLSFETVNSILCITTVDTNENIDYERTFNEFPAIYYIEQWTWPVNRKKNHSVVQHLAIQIAYNIMSTMSRIHHFRFDWKHECNGFHSLRIRDVVRMSPSNVLSIEPLPFDVYVAWCALLLSNAILYFLSMSVVVIFVASIGPINCQSVLCAQWDWEMYRNSVRQHVNSFYFARWQLTAYYIICDTFGIWNGTNTCGPLMNVQCSYGVYDKMYLFYRRDSFDKWLKEVLPFKLIKALAIACRWTLMIFHEKRWWFFWQDNWFNVCMCLVSQIGCDQVFVSKWTTIWFRWQMIINNNQFTEAFGKVIRCINKYSIRIRFSCIRFVFTNFLGDLFTFMVARALLIANVSKKFLHLNARKYIRKCTTNSVE